MKFNLINKNGDDITPFIEQYLRNRGVEETPEEFFNLSWEDVNPPTNLDYITEAAYKLRDHIEADSKIAILVDCDLDGFTSSSLLYNYISFFIEPGREWDSYSGEIVPIFHSGKMHGLDDTEVMKKLRDEIKPNLLLIPDASGTEEQCAALVALGIDIIILDHHDVDFRGDDESVIVVNNQQSERYTNKELSGVGVAWQFCNMLDIMLGWDVAGMYLDLVACGMVGDMMNLKSRETRFLVQEGLNNEHSFFLNFYRFTAYSMQNKPYNPHRVAFYIAPMFNAVCRIGDLKEKEMLWKALSDIHSEDLVENGTRGHAGEMVPLAQEAIRLASNAKGRQDRRKNKLADMIHELIREEGLINNQVLIFAFDDFKEEYRALSGLSANELSSYYHRPVIITFRKGNDYIGSLRVPDTDNPLYKNFKNQCEESGCCTFVAGHQEAAGIGIRGDSVDDLIDYFNKKYEGQDTDMMYDVDFVIDAADPRLPKLIEEFAKIKDMHGQGLKKPKFAITNVKIAPSTLRLVGAKSSTLWITLPNVKFINFKSSRDEYNSLLCKPDDSGVELYYSATVIAEDPDMNEWNGTITPQLQILDYDTGKVQYDF